MILIVAVLCPYRRAVIRIVKDDPVPKRTPQLITVGMLKQALEGIPDDHELDFSGLEFYRVKRRGPELLQIEFNELVYRDKETGLVVVENLG